MQLVVEFVELFQADFELEGHIEARCLCLQGPRARSEHLNVEVDFERDLVLGGELFESLVDLHAELNVVEHALQLGGVLKAHASYIVISEILHERH